MSNLDRAAILFGGLTIAFVMGYQFCEHTRRDKIFEQGRKAGFQEGRMYGYEQGAERTRSIMQLNHNN